MQDAFRISQTALYYPDFTQDGKISAVTSLANKAILPDIEFTEDLQDSPPAELLSRESFRWLKKEKISPFRLVLARQVHGNSIKYVTEPGDYADVDGFFTDRENLYLTIRTADCAAVMMYSAEIPVVGIAHVGWRGALANIVENLIQAMQNKWLFNPASLKVLIGPHIKSCCYAVGEELREFFPPETLKRAGGQLFFDLEKILFRQLLQQDIPAGNMIIAPFCTACAEIPLYSYPQTKNRQKIVEYYIN